MDTFVQAKRRGAFIFGLSEDGMLQDPRPTPQKERCEFRQYSQDCESNRLLQVKVGRPKRGLVAVEIDRLFCPEKNCHGPYVPDELEAEYHRLVGFFASRIVNPRYIKPSCSVAENPISTLTYFELPEHKLWQTLPDIIRFAKETLVFQRRLMEIERGGGDT